MNYVRNNQMNIVNRLNCLFYFIISGFLAQKNDEKSHKNNDDEEDDLDDDIEFSVSIFSFHNSE